MMRILYAGLILSILQLAGLLAQPTGPVIGSEFRDVPFDEFVEMAEQETGILFYYRSEWTKGIRVSSSGEKTPLEKILQKALLPAGLSYHLGPGGPVYIVPGNALITSLPDYGKATGRTGEEVDADAGNGMTDAERRYIDGRRAGLLETLTIGSEERLAGRSGAVIHGKITDVESGEPLIGATVYIQELKKGTVTDLDGRFSLVIPPGNYTAELNCMGMEDLQYYLVVHSEGNMSITMEKSLIPITEVVIRANRYHNVRGTQMGYERLNYKVLKEVPVVMGEKDLLKVVQMLPGVQSVGEGAAGFNVRGSGADQNMIYVNRVPVYNSSHLFGFFSSFSPDIVRDFTLYKSNLPASLGGRLASFFDISTRTGNMNQMAARGGISPITGHVAVEGPIRKEKLAFVLSARSTYSDWILDRMEDPDLRESQAGFYDLAGALTWEPGERTLVKSFGYYSSDRFSLGKDNDYGYANSGASVTVRHRFNSRLSGEMALVYGEYRFNAADRSIPSESYTHENRIGHYETRADFTWLSLGRHRVTFGGSAICYDLDRGAVAPEGEFSARAPLDLGREYGVETALYLADEISLTPRLTLYGGLRYASFLSLGPAEVMVYGEGQPLRPENVRDTLVFGTAGVARAYGGPEPRFSLNYLVGENHSVKFSYNRVRQYLFMLSNTVAISPTDQWKLCDYHIRPPYADQLSAGYYLDISRSSITTSVEVYRKWVSNLVEYRDGASFISSPETETQILQGRQDAYGAELMIRKGSGKLNGWLSYSYSRSFIRVSSTIAGESINGGGVYPANYDRPHNVSLVANFRLNRRLSVSSNVIYISGRPVTYPLSVYYVEGVQFIDYAGRNSYRIPDYFRFDLSFNLEGNLKRKKTFHSFWMLNFYNLTGRKNAYSVYFRSEEGRINGYKLSIFARPIVTLSWNFKLGNYASE